MIKFEELFVKAKGQPVVVDGITYSMMLRLNAKPGDVLCLIIDKLIHNPRQGIRIDSDKPIVVNEKTNKAHSCWLNVAPSNIVIQCPYECNLVIRNIWDYGDGVEQSLHAGGAMICTDIDGCKLVRCNSTLDNDDMNDLVFRVERGKMAQGDDPNLLALRVGCRESPRRCSRSGGVTAMAMPKGDNANGTVAGRVIRMGGTTYF